MPDIDNYKKGNISTSGYVLGKVYNYKKVTLNGVTIISYRIGTDHNVNFFHFIPFVGTGIAIASEIGHATSRVQTYYFYAPTGNEISSQVASNIKEATKFLNMGKFSEAAAQFDKAFKESNIKEVKDLFSNCKDVANIASEGQTLLKERKFSEAAAKFDEAIRESKVKEVKEKFLNLKSWAAANSLAEEANALYNARKYEEAIKKYNEGIQIDPSNKCCHSNKSLSLFNLKRYEEALESAKEALKIDPSCEDAKAQKLRVETKIAEANSLNKEGNNWYAAGKYKEAIKKYNEGIQIDPSNKCCHYNKSLSLLNLKRYKEALESVNEALKIDPNDEDAKAQKSCVETKIAEANSLNEEGLELLNSGKFSEAATKFGEAYKLSNVSEVYSEISNCRDSAKIAAEAQTLLSRGKFSEAAAQFDEAFIKSKVKEVSDIFSNCGDAAKTAAKGQTLLKEGKFSEAADKFDEAHTLSNVSEVYYIFSNCRDAVNIAAEAQALLKEGKFSEAAAHFDEAYSLSNVSEVYDIFSNCRIAAIAADKGLDFLKEGKFSEAAARFDEARRESNIKEAKDIFSNYKRKAVTEEFKQNFKIALSKMFNFLGEYQTAESLATQVLEKSPHNYKAQTQLTYAQEAIEKINDAQEKAKKAESSNKSENYQEAKEWANQALSVKPNNRLAVAQKKFAEDALKNLEAERYFTDAQDYFNTGDYTTSAEKCNEAFSTATKDYKNRPKFKAKQAECLNKLGRFKEAIECANLASTFFSRNEEAEQQKKFAQDTLNNLQAVKYNSNGLSFLANSEFKKAAEEFSKAFAISAESSEGRAKFKVHEAEALNKLGKYSEAVKSAQKALDLSFSYEAQEQKELAEDSLNKEKKGLELLKEGKFSEAAAHFDEARRESTVSEISDLFLNCRIAAIAADKGLDFLKEGKFSEAAAHFDEARRESNIKEAKDIFSNYKRKAVTEEFKQNFKIALSKMFNFLGEYQTAESLATQVLEKSPHNYKAQTQLTYAQEAIEKINDAQAKAKKAESSNKSENYQEAKEWANQALSVKPNNRLAVAQKKFAEDALKNSKAEDYFTEAQNSFAREDYNSSAQKCNEAFNTATKDYKNRPKFKAKQAECLNKLGRFKEAIECANLASTFFSRNEEAEQQKKFAQDAIKNDQAESHRKAGSSLYDEGQYKKAADEFILAFKVSVESDDKRASYKTKEAECWNKLGKYTEAISCTEKALVLNPNDQKACNEKKLAEDSLINLKVQKYYSDGKSYLESGKPEKAIALAEKALELIPKFTEAQSLKQEAEEYIQNSKAEEYNLQGTKLFEGHEYTQAVLMFKRAYDESTEGYQNKVIFKSNEAKSLNKLGEYKEASRCAKEALAINNHCKDAQEQERYADDFLAKIDKAAKTAKILFEDGLTLWEEGWEAENSEEDEASARAEEKFASAKTKLKEACHLFYEPEYQKFLTMVNLKIGGNNLFNEGYELYKRGKSLNEQKRYSEALEKYSEACKKFKEGSKLDERFKECITFVEGRIQHVEKRVAELFCQDDNSLNSLEVPSIKDLADFNHKENDEHILETVGITHQIIDHA